MTDKLHYYLESNDPVLYPIKHKMHVPHKINMLNAEIIQYINYSAPCSLRQYGEYRASMLAKFVLNQTTRYRSYKR